MKMKYNINMVFSLIIFFTVCTVSKPFAFDIGNVSTDSYPSLYDGKVAWVGYADYGNPEIHYFDGMDIIRITDNDEPDYDPHLYKDKIAWQSKARIMLWDGKDIGQISADGLPASCPSLYDGCIAYVGYDASKANGFEIYYWDGEKNRQITDNNIDDTYPCLNNGQIVWQAFDGNDYEICYWDGSSIVAVTDNDFDDVNPKISGNYVVWEANQDIYVWDKKDISRIPDIGKNQDEIDQAPTVSGSKIAWIKKLSDGRTGIYLYDLASRTGKLFGNGPRYSYKTASIDHDQIAVFGTVEHDPYSTPQASIFLFNIVDGELVENTTYESTGCFLETILKYIRP